MLMSFPWKCTLDTSWYIIKYKNKAVSTIQRDPKKKLVRCVKHDPSHKIQHIDVSYFSGYFL